jgi:hypothetical protein
MAHDTPRHGALARAVPVEENGPSRWGRGALAVGRDGGSSGADVGRPFDPELDDEREVQETLGVSVWVNQGHRGQTRACCRTALVTRFEGRHRVVAPLRGAQSLTPRGGARISRGGPSAARRPLHPQRAGSKVGTGPSTRSLGNTRSGCVPGGGWVDADGGGGRSNADADGGSGAGGVGGGAA